MNLKKITNLLITLCFVFIIFNNNSETTVYAKPAQENKATTQESKAQVKSQAINQIPARPNTEKLVFNLSKLSPPLLSEQEIQSLDYNLQKFAQESSNQILILIVDTLAGMEVNDFSTQVFNSWGLGQKDKNNGVLILIKPTESEGGRKIYINVGYGLESVIPDLMAKRIINELIVPGFKQGAYFQALDKASSILIKLAIGEYKEEIPQQAKSKSGLLLILLFPFIFMFLAENFFHKTGQRIDINRSGYRKRASSYILPFWGASYMSNRYLSSHHNTGSSFSDFGGFGGFGGGMSGGGGAGGSW